MPLKEDSALKADPNSALQNIFKFMMVLEEETWQKLEIFSEKTKRKGKFSVSSIRNCAFPLSFHGEILMKF